jgi:hypothetical protein
VVKNEWSYTCTRTALLYLLQENAIPKTQQFIPAMEADTLLLILPQIYKKFQNPTLSDTIVSLTSAVY